MNHCDDPKPQACEGADLRRDALLQALVLQQGVAVEHRERVGHGESRPANAGGSYVSMRPPIAGPGMVEHAVCALREALSDGEVDEVSRRWSAVEQCLTEHEREELRPRVFERLHPDDSPRRMVLRHGDAALGGR